MLQIPPHVHVLVAHYLFIIQLFIYLLFNIITGEVMGPTIQKLQNKILRIQDGRCNVLQPM